MVLKANKKENRIKGNDSFSEIKSHLSIHSDIALSNNSQLIDMVKMKNEMKIST